MRTEEQALSLTEKLLIRLLKKQTYFAELLVTLNIKEVSVPPKNLDAVKSGKSVIPEFEITAFVDNEGNLVFNKDFMEWVVQKENSGEAHKFTSIAIFVHELLHLIHNDIGFLQKKLAITEEDRRETVKMRLNIAADIAVNQQLPWVKPVKLTKEDKQRIKEGEGPTPETQEKISNSVLMFFPEYFGFPEGLTTAEYYELLPKDKKSLQNMLLKVGLDLSSVRDHKLPESHHIPQTVKEALLNKLKDLASQVHTRGTMPALIRNLVEKVLKQSKLPWNLLLRHYVKTSLLGKRNLLWKRPCRRTGVFPGRHREKRHRILLAIDTSGSTMSKRSLFLNEMDIIYKQTKAEIDVVECDAAVAPNMPYRYKGQEIKSMTGGGGTAFLPVFEWVKKNYRGKPDMLIFFTDGYGEHPEQPDYVNYPVIWVTTAANPADWGRIITFEGEEK